MFQPVERLVEAANKVWVSRVLESGRLSSKHCLRQSTMEESILDIELVNRPLAGESQRENRANCGRFNDWAECLGKVNTRALSEATKNPTCLVTLQRTVGEELVLENPLAGDNVGMSGARNQIPSLVLKESSMFFFHGGPPIGIGKGTAEGLRDWSSGAAWNRDGTRKPSLARVVM